MTTILYHEGVLYCDILQTITVREFGVVIDKYTRKVNKAKRIGDSWFTGAGTADFIDYFSNKFRFWALKKFGFYVSLNPLWSVFDSNTFGGNSVAKLSRDSIEVLNFVNKPILGFAVFRLKDAIPVEVDESFSIGSGSDIMASMICRGMDVSEAFRLTALADKGTSKEFTTHVL